MKFKSEFLNQNVFSSIKETNNELSKYYKTHLTPMDNNVFYFKDSLRIKILRKKNIFRLSDGSKKWTQEALFTELDQYIGDPGATEDKSYPDLINAAQSYWKKYTDKNSGWGRHYERITGKE